MVHASGCKNLRNITCAKVGWKVRPTEDTTVAVVNVEELKSKLGNFDGAQIYRVHGIAERENKRTSDGLESSRGEAGLKTIGEELPFWIPPGGG